MLMSYIATHDAVIVWQKIIGKVAACLNLRSRFLQVFIHKISITLESCIVCHLNTTIITTWLLLESAR